MADKSKALKVIYAASQYVAPGQGPKVSLYREIFTGLGLGLIGGVAWKVCMHVTRECRDKEGGEGWVSGNEA